MKKKKEVLTIFNRQVVTMYERDLNQKLGINLEVLEKVELVEDYLLFLESKGLQVESDYRKDIENYTRNDDEKRELEAFYKHIEEFFNPKIKTIHLLFYFKGNNNTKT